MSATLEQRREALVLANARRDGRAAAKRAVANGHRPIAAVLADQDEPLAGMMLADLLLLAPRFGRRKLQVLGRRACAANVNLLVTLGQAPVHTRAWLARELGAAPPLEVAA